MRDGYIEFEARRARESVERDFYAERALSARASAWILVGCMAGIGVVVAGSKLAHVMGWW